MPVLKRKGEGMVECRAMLADDERLKIREIEGAVEFYLSKLNGKRIIMLAVSGDDLRQLQKANESRKAEILHQTISALQKLLNQE